MSTPDFPRVVLTCRAERDIRLRALKRQERSLRNAIRRATDPSYTVLSPHGVRLLEDELYRNLREQAHLKTIKF